jgi:chromosome segregation ATPase
MSFDRVCHMSDLNAFGDRIRRDIASAESAAHRAMARVDSLRNEMKAANARINDLISDMSHLSDTLADQKHCLYGLESEISALQAQQQADHQVITRNQELIVNLQQDLSILERDVENNRETIAQVRQHIHVLQQELELAQERITENGRHIQYLEAGVQQINSYLAAERQRHEAEVRAKMDDLDAQGRLAAELRAQIDPARARFFGLYNEYLAAITMMDQAEQNRLKGNLEVAISQYQQAQSALIKVVRDADEQERKFENKRGLCQATLDQLAAELQLLGNPDMQTWYPIEYAQLQKRFQTLQEDFASRKYETAGDPVEVRLALESLTNQGMQIYQDIRLLESKLAATMAQHLERKARLREILDALRRLWDQRFDHEITFINPQDPKSTLKLQTKRPGAPNVTVYLDLDRTIQFSWTGYEGMKCVEDIQQFEQLMLEKHQVKVDVVGTPIPRPDYPNPDFGGGGGRVSVPEPLHTEKTPEHVIQK